MRRTRCLLATLLVSLGLIATLLGACGNGGKPSPSELLDAAQQRGPYGVGVTTIELVDTSRPTEANGDVPASAERKLRVEVWYPADAAAEEPEARDVPLDRNAEPYPLIILAHGLSANRRLYASYGQHLASHGYVVGAPDFPSSNLSTPGGPRLNAVLEQPGDVSFVIDQMLAFNEQSGHLLEDAVDPEEIGMTGHSLGALTTMMAVYGTERDDRIKAALPMSTVGCFLPDGFGGETSVPIMAVVGTNDLITPPVTADRGYAGASPPRYLVHITGADHVRFADADVTDESLLGQGGVAGLIGSTFVSDAVETAQTLGGDATVCLNDGPGATDPPITGDRQRELLRSIAVPFFDAYLRGDRASRDVLQELPDLLPEVRLESDPG